MTIKSVGTGPSSYWKSIYQAAVSQSLRKSDLDDTLSLQPNASLFSSQYQCNLSEVIQQSCLKFTINGI